MKVIQILPAVQSNNKKNFTKKQLTMKGALNNSTYIKSKKNNLFSTFLNSIKKSFARRMEARKMKKIREAMDLYGHAYKFDAQYPKYAPKSEKITMIRYTALGHERDGVIDAY